ncbi:MAG: metallophosphoesterase [Christensenella sp.]|nr:metallophosphoesterase [Christensenella sp.]
MNIYAIGDLHLSNAQPKAMDVFGRHWKDHFIKISEDWISKVTSDDVVLIPGDISWAMKLDEAKPDLDAIGALPGLKILLRGNHDYWWGSIAKMERVLPDTVKIIQNNSISVGDYVFCGTRGWMLPSEGGLSENDKKIYEREKQRLRLSLDSTKKYSEKKLIALMHFPPLYEQMRDTEFTEIFQEYDVSEVVFGHLHGEILNRIHLDDILVGTVNYNLVSADYLDFRLKQII